MKKNEINIKEKIAFLECLDDVIRTTKAQQSAYEYDANDEETAKYYKPRYDAFDVIISHLYELAK